MPGTETPPVPPATGGTETPPATGEGDKAPTTPPATGATGKPGTGAGAAPTTDDTPPLTPEQIAEVLASNAKMEAALKSANKEAEKLRREAKEKSDADKSAEEKAAEELADLRKKQESWQVERAGFQIAQQVNRLQPTLGLVDAEIVYSLLDWDDIDFDEDGTPDKDSVEKAVKALIVRKPILAGKVGAQPGQPTGNNAGDGTGGTPPPSLTQEELESAKRTGLSPERYAALKGVKTLADWQQTRRTGQGS